MLTAIFSHLFSSSLVQFYLLQLHRDPKFCICNVVFAMSFLPGGDCNKLSDVDSLDKESTSPTNSILLELPSLVIPTPTIAPENIEATTKNQRNSGGCDRNIGCATNSNGTFVTPKKRKAKLLPPDLAVLNDSKFVFTNAIDTNPKSSTYGREIQIAKSVYMQDGSMFDLSTLTIDQIRSLVKNIGIGNCGSANKLSCYNAIPTYFNYQSQLIICDLKPTTHATRLTSSICRAVNIVFTDMFIEEFLTVNDRNK
jgi:hypothetical protein